MHWIVIPFRGAGTAKSRLADGLSDAARQQVARAMFQHVLNVSAEVAGSRRVLVTTPCESASRIARRAGAAVLEERSSGLNAAVEAARRHLHARGALTATVVAADLPLLKPSNLDTLMRCVRDGFIGIAPDRDGSGTNALALPVRVPFRFQFGTQSRYFHQMQSRHQGFLTRLLRQPGLASDVDEPQDMELLTDPFALSTLPQVSSGAFRGLR